jgi:outer membrane protein TolC
MIFRTPFCSSVLLVRTPGWLAALHRFALFVPFVLFVLCAAFLVEIARADAAALSIGEAQRLATLDAPQVEAQAATLRAARQARISAGEQADPKLILGIDNIPADSADRFNITRDFMTMRRIGLMQEFTADEKLKLRGARADAEINREAAVLAVTEINLQRDVALAWIERYFAERQRALLIEMTRETELQISATNAAVAGGKGMVADGFAARLANAQLDDRLIDNERLVARAEANLGRYIGAAAKQPLDAAPAFDALAHRHRALTTDLDHHPHLAMFAPEVVMAESELGLARAAKYPDWSLEVGYALRGPAYSNMLSIGVRIDLPIFQSRRQDPAVAVKLAQVERVRAQAEDARRSHAAEIDGLLADWQAAGKRVQRYQSELIPLSQERSEAALAGYRGGRGDLMPVLDARRQEIEMRINQLTAQAEQARAWANLNYLLAE